MAYPVDRPQTGRAARRRRTFALSGTLLVLLVLGWGVHVDYEWYDGCNWHAGTEPVLAVPISLATERPIAEDAGFHTLVGCEQVREEWAFEVGPFGSVPDP